MQLLLLYDLREDVFNLLIDLHILCVQLRDDRFALADRILMLPGSVVPEEILMEHLNGEDDQNRIEQEGEEDRIDDGAILDGGTLHKGEDQCGKQKQTAE